MGGQGTILEKGFADEVTFSPKGEFESHTAIWEDRTVSASTLLPQWKQRLSWAWNSQETGAGVGGGDWSRVSQREAAAERAGSQAGPPSWGPCRPWSRLHTVF